MELIGVIDKEEYSITVEQQDEHHYQVTIDGRVYVVDCLETMPHVYSLIHSQHSYEARIHRDPQKDACHIHFDKDSYKVQMFDPMARLLEGAGGRGQSGAATLEAPMPGMVQRLLVKEGDTVEEEQGLVVLVAMKMENELGSPKAGVVKQILVKDGDSVEGSAPLVIVE